MRVRTLFVGGLCMLLLASCPGNRWPVPGDHAGFVTIDPVDFSFSNDVETLALRSSRAHIFYSFQAADTAPEDKPIALFFNGGPGSATTCGLWTMNTGRNTLIEGAGFDIASTVAHDNPNSWTGIANLLHVDARGTGFSYCETENAHDSNVRAGEFNAHNYNVWLDAADFARVLLEIFERFPALCDNPVIVVGESYGGTRAPMLLHLLQNYARYADGTMPYQDPALVKTLQRHYEQVFHRCDKGETVPPETIAQQFGRQVLIQPLVTSAYWDLSLIPMRAPDGPIPVIESETGVLFDTYAAQYDDKIEAFDHFIQAANRDIYCYPQASGWVDGFFTSAGEDILDETEFEALSGTPWANIAAFQPENRTGAYRAIAPVPKDEDESVGKRAYGMNMRTGTGPLFRPIEQMSPFARMSYLRMKRAAENARKAGGTADFSAWDNVYLPFSDDIIEIFYYNTLTEQFDMPEAGLDDPIFGRIFLETLTHTQTFITNAAYDLVLYSPAIPLYFEAYADLVASAAIVPGAQGEEAAIQVQFKPGVFDLPETPNDPALTRTIRFPHYANSGHPVSLTEPAKFRADVSAWLEEDGENGG